MATSGGDVQGRVEQDSEPSDQTTARRKNITEVDAIFGGRDDLDPAAEYTMNHKRRGLALIFNQERFFWQLCMPERHGTNADRWNLMKRLEDLKFDVKVHDNLKVADVVNVITEAANSDHTDADCFVCVFLSHGLCDEIYAYDGKFNIQEITALFKGDKCRSLVGKPKIFIFQACRGEVHDVPVTPMDVVDNEVDNEVKTNEVVVDAGVVHTLPAGADFLMCYSVAEGYYSHRETINGSWYIQDLCQLLQKFGEKLELTELLTVVNRKVSMRKVGRSSDPNAIGKKQVPCFSSMLTKKLYFRAKEV
ncbi:hypothetical protein COCON_G00122310 [Conger conger]|uniref:Caspase-6 n=1 Tax=Conger conger TaxID=82655 RepID=A0A9Q1DH29_CONCO|nr:caspase-6-like [Conger conger]KAJ8269624.1 hypothetical protein COCON_G00122310 [Conger conger]